MNINRWENRICNAGWIVLAGLLLALWIDSADARFLTVPAAAVAVVEDYNCGGAQ